MRRGAEAGEVSMTSRDFCYWLQGYFELGSHDRNYLGPEQVECIRKHLALVFTHEIDPSQSKPATKTVLMAIG